MALNGSFSGSIRSGYGIRVDWSAVQSIDNNTSAVTAKLYFINDWSINISGRPDNTISIGGTSFTVPSSAFTTTGTHYIGSATKTISHSNDGSINTINISAVFYIRATISGVYYNSITASANVQLDTIPRATRPTLSSGSVDMGSAVTITLNRASSSFTHSLSYSFEGASGSIGSGIATSKSWTAPDLASKIPNKNSGTCTITCVTYNGSTVIGTTSVNLTLNVPASVIPTVSLNVSEAVSAVKTKLGIFAKDLSKLAVKATGTGVKGSTITTYNINANGMSYSSDSITTEALKTSGQMTISATVTDSRGRTGSVSTTISVADYAKPYITTFKAERGATEGTVVVTIAGGITGLTGNTPSYKLEYKKRTATSYTVQTISNTGATINKTINLTGIDINSQYDFVLTIADQFYSSVASDYVNTTFVLVDYNAGGKSFAFGKVSETADMIESDIPFLSYQRMMVGTIEDLRKTYISNQWIGFYKADGNRVACLGSNGSNDLNLVCENGALYKVNAESIFYKKIMLSNGSDNSLYVKRADGTGVQIITLNSDNQLLLGKGQCDSGGSTWLYGKAISLKSGASNNLNTLVFDTNGCLSLSGGTGINQSYGCMSNNELTIKTANAGIWFNYRTATGGVSPTTYNFGDGNKGYATIYCKTLSQTSDRKVKTEIEEISKAYEFIMGLEPVMFEFTDSEHHRKHMGFIAQDVAQTAKDIEIGDLSLYQASVIDDKNDDKPQLYFNDDVPDERLCWSLNYSEFIAPLIKVVQDQQKTINDLTKRVERLELEKENQLKD